MTRAQTDEALAAERKETDDQIAARNQQVTDLEAQVADLTKQLSDCQSGGETKTLWGANFGGYSAQGETAQAAYARIKKGFGAIAVARWWPNNFFANWSAKPSWLDAKVFANLGSDIDGVNSGRYDAAFANIVKTAPAWTALSCGHEPEDDVFEAKAFTLANWQKAQMRLGRICRDQGRKDVWFGPLLMGSSYHPNRYQSAATGNVPASEWLNFDLTNIDMLCGDFYQWGTNDTNADPAERLIGDYLKMCAAKGKKGLIGELGARRVNPPYNPGISDQARANFINGVVKLLDETDVDILGVMYYESDRGQATKVPWMLLDNAAGNGVKSPKAAAAYKAVCTR
jgi:hypothetical protein